MGERDREKERERWVGREREREEKEKIETAGSAEKPSGPAGHVEHSTSEQGRLHT